MLQQAELGSILAGLTRYESGKVVERKCGDVPMIYSA